MKKLYNIALIILMTGITAYGLITGKYLFLFLMLPVGLSVFGNKKSD